MAKSRVCIAIKDIYLNRFLRIASRLFPVSLILLFVVACQATTPQAALEATVVVPTQVALALVPEDTAVPTATATYAGTALPATWTPFATAGVATRADNLVVVTIDPNAPTLEPSLTPFIPTHTPVVPTATATNVTTVTPQGPAIDRIPTLPPTSELGPSKLGIHVIQNNDPRIMEFIRNAQPAVVKAVGDLGFLSEVKEVSPRTITIGRIDDIYAQNYGGDPVEAAQDYVNRHLPSYLLNPGVDYWEGWNEPDPNMNNMRWYAAYEVERVRLLAQNGLKAAIGGFPTGVPEVEEFRLFIPAIEAAKQYSGILSLHEYGAPDMLYLVGSPLPNRPGYADRGALTLRYRWFYEEYLIPQDLVIPLAITEAGVDGIIGNRPGPDGKGWHNFSAYWVDAGWGDTGKQAYINQLAWYDAEVRKDGYVIGFTVFTAGDIKGWETYEIDTILPDLAGYVNGQR